MLTQSNASGVEISSQKLLGNACSLFCLFVCFCSFVVCFVGWFGFGFGERVLCVALANARTHSVDQAGMKLTEIHLSLPPKY